MSFKDITLEEFMNRLASDSPTPGGGSAAAMAGAMGSCLVSMVANLTVGREKFKEYEEQVQEILTKSEELRARLLASADRDAEAFNLVIDAMKMPKVTEEEKRIRTEKLQEALKGATARPMEIAELCLEVLKLAWELHDKGNPNASSDIGVGTHMAYAGMEGAIMNVDINLPLLKDGAFAEKMKTRADRLRAEGNRIYRNIAANVKF
jgi:formiminotetrahydrofolate cyclodeaminase